MTKRHGENEVICMDYEHDNEQGAGRGQRESSMRDGRRYSQGNTQRIPYQEGQAPRRGDWKETAGIQGSRNTSDLGRTGTGKTASSVSRRPSYGGGRTSSTGQISEARQMQRTAGKTGAIRIPAAGKEDTKNPSARRSNVRAASDTARAMRETAAGREATGSRNGTSRVVSQAKYERARLKKRRRRIITMIVAECFTLMFIFGYSYLARRFNMIQREDFDPKEVENKEISLDTTQKMKGYRMIAIFGVDSRDSNVGAGCQSDVNMICCINEDTGEIKLVSVYRDTYLNINDQGSYRKFNASYTNGGPEQALRALNKNLDLNITQYVTFNWKSVADGINILGGVDLDITKSEFRFINGFITETVEATGVASRHLTSAGPQHLDGVQAVAYGRLRLMDTDFARTERQRKIIELAFAKAKQADYSVLNNILVVILPSISTNISFADMTSMALGINKYYIGETAGFPFAKGAADIPGKGDCVIPQTLVSNVSQLHTFLFGDEAYDPTEQVKTISNKIASDSGMYREGKVSTGSALTTDSYVPKETTKAVVTEEETTTKETETEESEELKPSETGRDGNIIDEFPDMTDENGELIDGPVDDWPEEADPSPGGTSQESEEGPGTLNPSQPGSNHTIGRPDQSSETSEGYGPGQNTGPGGTRIPTEPGDSEQVGGNAVGGIDGPNGAIGGGTVMPGGNTSNPEGNIPSPGGTPPGGNTSSPGGDSPSPGDTSPGGNGTVNQGDSSPGGSSTINPGDTPVEGPGSTPNGPGDMLGGNDQSPQGPGL